MSVNSLLSVYTTIFKAALIYIVAQCMSQAQWSWYDQRRPLYDLKRFDDAGRGVWGSILWLWSHHLRQPLVALGAVIMIAGLAVEPFVQQLVNFSDCSVVLDSAENLATMARTNYFAPSILGGLAVSDPEAPIIPSEIAASVVGGYFGSPISVESECSTGNCTFSTTYSTVGYCSACEDVSDQLVIQTINLCPTNWTNCGQVGITTTLPLGTSSNSSMTSSLSPTTAGQVGLFSMEAIGRDTFNDYQIGGSNGFQVLVLAGKNPLPNPGIDKTTGLPFPGCNDPTNNNTWECRGYGAAKCTMQQCVRTYSANIASGIMTEMMIDYSNPYLSWGHSILSNETARQTWGLVDTQCISSVESSQLIQLGYNISASDRWLPYNLTFNASAPIPVGAPFPQSLLANGCLYLIDVLFTLSIGDNFLNALFSGNVSGQIGISVNSFSQFLGSQSAEYMYNYGAMSFSRVNNIFQNASESFTNYIRQNGLASQSAPAQGAALHYATCLRVNWTWIAMPASLVALTLVLFSVTMVKAAMEQAPMWKTNPLAYIFHGPGWIGTYKPVPAGDLSTERGMSEFAKRTMVRLDRTGSEMRLVEVA